MPKAKIKIVRGIPAELHAHPRVWNIHVNLVLIAGVVVRVEPVGLVDAPDGEYELRFPFEGRQEVRHVRVERGDMLGLGGPPLY
jgi:hypothetical protein